MKHGGNFTEAAQAFGLDASEIIDLSTGISPRSYPIEGFNLSARHWRDLPQAETEQALISAMRTAWNVDSDAEIVLTPGSGISINMAAVIWGQSRRDQSKVLIPAPVYSEHEIAWQSLGHGIEYYQAGTIPTLKREQSSEDASAPSIVIAVQPGNPLGNSAEPDEWLELIDELAEKNGLLVMDEAFIDLMPSKSLAPFAGRKGLMIIRSFGKFYGLAGLRLGAAIGHADDMALLKQFLGPWAVSTPALEIGLAAINDNHWAEGQRLWAKQEMAQLLETLSPSGLVHIGGTDLYALMEMQNAKNLHLHLAKHGIWTRIFEKYPHWIRFGLPMNTAERERLRQALIMGQNHH